MFPLALFLPYKTPQVKDKTARDYCPGWDGPKPRELYEVSGACRTLHAPRHRQLFLGWAGHSVSYHELLAPVPCWLLVGNNGPCHFPCATAYLILVQQPARTGNLP